MIPNLGREVFKLNVTPYHMFYMWNKTLWKRQCIFPQKWQQLQNHFSLWCQFKDSCGKGLMMKRQQFQLREPQCFSLLTDWYLPSGCGCLRVDQLSLNSYFLLNSVCQG